MKKNKLPDFLIVGSAKSGTTAVARYLEQSPNIFIPEIKECDFFSEVDGVFEGPKGKFQKLKAKTKEEYISLYKNAGCNQIKGDVSPTYMLFHEKAIKNIKKDYGQAGEHLPKIIIILRNPIERAFSNFMHLVRDMKVNEDFFLKEFKSEEFKKENNWHWFWRFRELGMYSAQVKNYITNFDHIKVLFYHDFISDNSSFLNEITDFLGINRYDFDFKRRYNESGIPKGKTKQKVIRAIKIPGFLKPIIPFRIRDYLKSKKEKLIKQNLSKKSISLEEYDYLKTIYAEDIKKLEKLLKKDLTRWYY